MCKKKEDIIKKQKPQTVENIVKDKSNQEDILKSYRAASEKHRLELLAQRKEYAEKAKDLIRFYYNESEKYKQEMAAKKAAALQAALIKYNKNKSKFEADTQINSNQKKKLENNINNQYRNTNQNWKKPYSSDWKQSENNVERQQLGNPNWKKSDNPNWKKPHNTDWKKPHNPNWKQSENKLGQEFVANKEQKPFERKDNPNWKKPYNPNWKKPYNNFESDEKLNLQNKKGHNFPTSSTQNINNSNFKNSYTNFSNDNSDWKNPRNKNWRKPYQPRGPIQNETWKEAKDKHKYWKRVTDELGLNDDSNYLDWQKKVHDRRWINSSEFNWQLPRHFAWYSPEDDKVKIKEPTLEWKEAQILLAKKEEEEAFQNQLLELNNNNNSNNEEDDFEFEQRKPFFEKFESEIKNRKTKSILFGRSYFKLDLINKLILEINLLKKALFKYPTTAAQNIEPYFKIKEVYYKDSNKRRRYLTKQNKNFPVLKTIYKNFYLNYLNKKNLLVDELIKIKLKNYLLTQKKRNKHLKNLIKEFLIYYNLKQGAISIKNINKTLSVDIKELIWGKMLEYTPYNFRRNSNVADLHKAGTWLLQSNDQNAEIVFNQILARYFKYTNKNMHNKYFEYIQNFFTTLVEVQNNKYIKKKEFLDQGLMDNVKLIGIKLIVTGRLRGKPRSDSEVIMVGNVPTQTLSKLVKYSSVTSYTYLGTFGFKLWVVYDKTKEKNLILKLRQKSLKAEYNKYLKLNKDLLKKTKESLKKRKKKEIYLNKLEKDVDLRGDLYGKKAEEAKLKKRKYVSPIKLSPDLRNELFNKKLEDKEIKKKMKKSKLLKKKTHLELNSSPADIVFNYETFNEEVIMDQKNLFEESESTLKTKE